MLINDDDDDDATASQKYNYRLRFSPPSRPRAKKPIF